MKKITGILLSLALAALLCTGTCLTAFAAEAAPTVSIPVEIALSGTLPDTAEDFTVKLEAKDAVNPMPEGSEGGVYTMAVTGAGTKSFTITYTGVGIYEYSIYQVEGSNADVTYDNTVYQLAVYVTNAEDGSGLEVAAVLYPDEASTKDPSAAFTNVYPTVTPDTEPDTEPDTDPATSGTSESPKTGDDSAPGLYVALAGASAAAIVLLVAARKRAGKTRG